MKYEMMPVVDCCDLEDAVNLQYGCEIESIANLLFGDEYINDSYKRFYFEELAEYKGYSWQDEEVIRLTNLVKTYLQDVFPNHKCCLIDVSW